MGKDEIKEEIKTEEQDKTVPNAPKEAKKIQNAMMKENQAVPKQAPTNKTDEANIKDAQGKLIPKQSTEIKDKENMEKKETNQTPSLKEIPKDSKKMAELPKVEEKKNETIAKTEQITKAQNPTLDNLKAGNVRAKCIDRDNKNTEDKSKNDKSFPDKSIKDTKNEKKNSNAQKKRKPMPKPKDDFGQKMTMTTDSEDEPLKKTMPKVTKPKEEPPLPKKMRISEPSKGLSKTGNNFDAPLDLF